MSLLDNVPSASITEFALAAAFGIGGEFFDSVYGDTFTILATIL